MRYETVDVDAHDKDDSDYASAGFNYYIKGNNAKISMDYTYVDNGRYKNDQSIATFQLAVGF